MKKQSSRHNEFLSEPGSFRLNTRISACKDVDFLYKTYDQTFLIQAKTFNQKYVSAEKLLRYFDTLLLKFRELDTPIRFKGSLSLGNQKFRPKSVEEVRRELRGLYTDFAVRKDKITLEKIKELVSWLNKLIGRQLRKLLCLHKASKKLLQSFIADQRKRIHSFILCFSYHNSNVTGCEENNVFSIAQVKTLYFQLLTMLYVQQTNIYRRSGKLY